MPFNWFDQKKAELIDEVIIMYEDGSIMDTKRKAEQLYSKFLTEQENNGISKHAIALQAFAIAHNCNVRITLISKGGSSCLFMVILFSFGCLQIHLYWVDDTSSALRVHKFSGHTHKPASTADNTVTKGKEIAVDCDDDSDEYDHDECDDLTDVEQEDYQNAAVALYRIAKLRTSERASPNKYFTVVRSDTAQAEQFFVLRNLTVEEHDDENSVP